MAYFSNGSEGTIIDEQCAACVLGEECCPVWYVQQEYNYKQCSVPELRAAMNLLIDEKGQCQLKPLLEKSGLSYRAAELCGQQKLFKEASK